MAPLVWPGLFFDATAVSVFYALSLHDALPIFLVRVRSATWVMAVGSEALSLPVFSWPPPETLALLERQSTRLNSTHVKRSYAVYCSQTASTSLRVAVMVWPLKETAQPLTVPLSAAVGV